MIRTETVDVTPALATEWLDASEDFTNRNLRSTRVDQIVRDIRAGNWKFNGESIKFDTQGRVIDGQHRLHAIIQANVPVRTIVVHGLPTETVSTSTAPE